MLADHIKDHIAHRLEDAINTIEYFYTDYDPAWHFDALLTMESSLMEGRYDSCPNPCAGMVGDLWKDIKCRGKYQELARKQVITLFFGINTEVDRMVKRTATPCEAV